MSANMSAEAACEICGRTTGARYAFRARDENNRPIVRCWRHAPLYRPVFQQALRVAGVVGTILFCINQADVVFSGRITALVVVKIILTYFVPFLVSTYSALEVNHIHRS